MRVGCGTDLARLSEAGVRHLPAPLAHEHRLLDDPRITLLLRLAGLELDLGAWKSNGKVSEKMTGKETDGVARLGRRQNRVSRVLRGVGADTSPP